ncbi:MAG: LamG domain-containing protein [Spirochaetota bacterium]
MKAKYLFFIIPFVLCSCNPFRSSDVDFFSRIAGVVTNDTSSSSTSSIVYSVKGSLQSSDGSPVSGGSMNVSTISTALKILPQNVDNGTTTVTEKPPGKLSFTDIDPGAESFAGPVVIQKASDEADIDFYNLYWSDIADRKIKRIAKLTKSGNNYTYVFPLGTVPPEGATHLLAVSGNAAGEAATGTNVKLKDTLARFETDEAGSYTMTLGPGGFNVLILSKDGTELGEMTLELPSTYAAGDPVPQPTPTSGDFSVTVTGFGSGDAPVTEIPLASTKDLTAFSFSGISTTGIITGTSITVGVPSGTPVTGLTAIFTTTGKKVIVGSTEQTSGTTSNDFTNPVTYKVLAEDGTSQTYTVTVIQNNAPSVTTASVSASSTASGSIVSASYTYSDPDSNPEGLTTFQWYRCTDNTTTGSCTAVAGATASSYTLTVSDSSNYMRVGVTPVDSYGLAGSLYYSTASAQVYSDTTAPTTGGSGLLSISNVTSTSLTLSWTAATDDFTAQSSLVYYVYRSESPELYTVGSMIRGSRTTFIGAYTATTSLNITGLLSNVPTYFNVYVQDLSGNRSRYKMVQEIPATGLVAYYKLDASTGYATDQIGSYSGTAYGITSTTDRAGYSSKAPYFDNSNADRIQPSTVVPVNSTFTYAAWVYLNSTSDENDIIAWYGSGSLHHAEFRVITGGKIEYLENNGAGANIQSASSLSTGTWYHVAVTKTGGTVTLYINGASDASGTVNQAGSFDTTLIGARGDNALNMHGRIDDLRVYNRVLSADELKYLASNIENDTLAYYTFNAGTANNQNTSGSYNGTLFNGITSTTDRFGTSSRAFSFDGIDDYISLGNSSGLKPTTGLTISTWIYQADYTTLDCTSNFKALMSNATTTAGYRLGCDTSYTGFNGAVYRNGSFGRPQTSKSLSAGWHHLVTTYDRNNGKIFIDGVLMNTVSSGGTYNITYDGDNYTLLGADAVASGVTPEANTYYSGKIDDVRIYNRALSEAEVWALHQAEN